MEIGKQVGEYIIEAEIGGGGMAKVYRARHAVLESLHALKVLDDKYRANPEARRRFLDEAKIQAKHIQHPGIVKVTNIVSTEDAAALVMDLVEGGSLESYMTAKKRPFTADELLTFAIPILDAMSHAHDAGIIHRDIKPANVLLKRQGDHLVPMITDFGIAKVIDHSASSKKKSTHADARMGTLGYMSPEQIRKAKDVSPRSDIFSLGAMFYEMVTGRVPFDGESDFDIMEAIVHGRFDPPEKLAHASITPNILTSIKKAMDGDPERRFATCKEFADALTGGKPVNYVPIAKGSSGYSGGYKSGYSTGSSGGRNWKLFAGLAVVALAGGGAAVFFATRGPSKPAPIAGPGSGSGSGSSAASGADVLAKLVDFKDRMCACDDADCARRISEEMTSWSKGVSLANADQAKVLEVGNRMGECEARAKRTASATPPVDAAPPIDAPRTRLDPPYDLEVASDAIATAHGAKYTILETGTGTVAGEWDSVDLDFVVWSNKGAVVAEQTAGSADIAVRSLAPGFKDLVTTLPAGAFVRAWMPAALAGARGKGNVITEVRIAGVKEGKPPSCAGTWTIKGGGRIAIGDGSSCGDIAVPTGGRPCKGALTACNDGPSFTAHYHCTDGTDTFDGNVSMSCTGNATNISISITGGQPAVFSATR